MAVGLAQYARGRRRLPASAREVPNPLPPRARPMVAVACGAALAAVVLLAVTGVLSADRLATVVVIVSAAAAICYFVVILTSRRITAVERRRVLAFIPMFLASAAFWSLYQQQFTVVTIYSDQRLDRTLFGWEMPVSWVQSINPVFIIVLSGVFAALWTRLGDRQPSTPIKFAAGTAIMGVAFLLFLPLAGGGPNSTPLLALAGILLVFTIAELLLSPVGLSLSTKLAPRAFRTQMVALFFLSVALGTALSGHPGRLLQRRPRNGLLRRARRRSHRPGPGAGRRRQADQPPDERRPVTGHGTGMPVPAGSPGGRQSLPDSARLRKWRARHRHRQRSRRRACATGPHCPGGHATAGALIAGAHALPWSAGWTTEAAAQGALTPSSPPRHDLSASSATAQVAATTPAASGAAPIPPHLAPLGLTGSESSGRRQRPSRRCYPRRPNGTARHPAKHRRTYSRPLPRRAPHRPRPATAPHLAVGDRSQPFPLAVG